VAGVVGLIAVVAVMLIYYKRSGINAVLALILNAIILLAAVAYFGAVLTLPGIAGVILTIGMAVDSNVLIFERIREELTKLLTEGAAKAGFELLEKSWLLSIVLPEIAAMKGVPQPPQYHPEGDVWTHTLLMIEGLPAGTSPTLAWGVLLHDVGKPPTYKPASQTGDRIRFDHHVDVGVRLAEAICRRYRFSNEETEQIVALVANHMRFGVVDQMRTSTLKRFVRLPHFEELMALHRLDCLSSHRNLDAYRFVERFLAETPEEQVRPQRVLTGTDLSEMGYIPGPLFSEILRAVEDAQLEGQIATKEDAQEFVRKKFALNRTRV